ncbi:MAG: TonB-dependent receptor [Bacteroidota bacterium]|nr:TonB-dependent receptor [Bacteroidota bacterium]
MKKLFLIGIFILSSIVNAFPQQTATIFGKITGEERKPIPNANIIIDGHPGGTASAKDGSYQILVPAGKKITLLISFIGYETQKLEVLLKSGELKEYNIYLPPLATQLESIEVKDQQIHTQSFSRLNPKAVTLIPTMNASIEDLVKTLPGVASRNELSSTYSVRGGNYDENLVFVNDIEIYRPFLVRAGQQEGMSFLNPDLVSGISFSAGGFDARYGDKMSSVLDIRYKKPTSFAGSFDLSLLGANGHLEGKIGRKFSYLTGIRYKSNSYFLKGLDTKGNYKPRYFDFQSLFNYEVSKKFEISLMGTYSNNSFKLVPETRETSFGTLDEAYKIKMYFDGQEVDKYQNWLGALTLQYKPTEDIRLKLISSVFQTFESETYDISAEYWIGKLEAFQNYNEYGQGSEELGVGAYIDHARNYLNGTVADIEHLGSWNKGNSQMMWGIGYRHEFFRYKMNEWQLTDSAGYSLPHETDSVGGSHPPHNAFTIPDFIQCDNSTGLNKLSAFLQETWTFKKGRNDISLSAGLRTIYDDLNGQFLANPRATLSIKPHWKKEVVFRFSGGYYSQPPSFRELTDLNGNIISSLKAQTAFHAVAGTDLYFDGWGRPFKFVTEIYYKYMTHLIPYEIDNLEIRYYGNNNSFGYAAGIDFRINGEFVKGAESWASLSFMKTEENIDGYWVPRPTDQRVNLCIFFQDYVPDFPSWRVNLTLFYGTGLPFGAPGSPKKDQTLRIPDYRRVDIGLSKQIIGDQTFFSQKNPLRAFHSMWLAMEVFNLLQISNTVSYQWVTDINGQQYAVPNYLTPRLFNLKLIANF